MLHLLVVVKRLRLISCRKRSPESNDTDGPGLSAALIRRFAKATQLKFVHSKRNSDSGVEIESEAILATSLGV